MMLETGSLPVSPLKIRLAATTSTTVPSFYTLDDYAPNVVAGVGYTAGWGGIKAVAAYDAVWENFSAKVRVDAKFNDAFSLFVMGGWADKDEIEFFPGTTIPVGC